MELSISKPETIHFNNDLKYFYILDKSIPYIQFILHFKNAAHKKLFCAYFLLLFKRADYTTISTIKNEVNYVS